ncbi:hypothetical protein EKD04_016935 [Chloroflexales bacterium ZM16-3]|nr:hypothetical protein [Chloroflexales bacterium ZM16-3]
MRVVLLLPCPTEIARIAGDGLFARLILGCTPTGVIQMSLSAGLSLRRRPGGRVS